MSANPLLEKLAKELLESYGEPLSKTEAQVIEFATYNNIVWAQSLSALVSRRSLGAHAIALTAASDAQVRALEASSSASERHAKALVGATRVLAWATIVLAAATIILVIVTAGE